MLSSKAINTAARPESGAERSQVYSGAPLPFQPFEAWEADQQDINGTKRLWDVEQQSGPHLQLAPVGIYSYRHTEEAAFPHQALPLTNQTGDSALSDIVFSDVDSLYFTRSVASSHAGTLRGFTSFTQVPGARNLIQTQDGLLLHSPIEEFGPSFVLQGPRYIDMAISNFHIQFDHKDRFKPGEEMSGKVIMDVWSNVHILFVEFIIQGKGTVRIFKDTSTFLDQPRNEVYLNKNIILIGPQQQNGAGVTLTPGRYVSSFQYKLPEELPPTVHQFDMGRGHVFDISYNVEAHVCDKMRRRHQSPTGKMVRISKATKKTFTVTALQDWQSLPGATEPLMHAEKLQLFMSRNTKEPTTVLYTLNKAVYPLGHKIKLDIEVFNSSKKRIVKNVVAELEQEMGLSGDAMKRGARRVLIRAIDTQTMRHDTDHENMVRSRFSLPVPTNLVPSYLPHCSIMDIRYTLKVVIRFWSLGGALTVRLPFIIAPATGDPEGGLDVPVFNKPIMQFPYFSKSPIVADENNPFDTLGRASGRDSLHGTVRSLPSYAQANGTVRSHHSSVVANGHVAGTTKKSASAGAAAYKKFKDYERNENVTTKYEPGIACCSCWAACLGYGIYES